MLVLSNRPAADMSSSRELLEPGAIAMLRLTKWQVWALLRPGSDVTSILTPIQDVVFSRQGPVRPASDSIPSSR